MAVVDKDAQNGAKVAEQFGCKAFKSVEELLGWSKETKTAIHAASVAVPTVFHRGVAEQLMAAGADVLIEKPLAPNVADAGDRGDRKETGAGVAGGAHGAVQPGVSGA